MFSGRKLKFPVILIFFLSKNDITYKYYLIMHSKQKLLNSNCPVAAGPILTRTYPLQIK